MWLALSGWLLAAVLVVPLAVGRRRIDLAAAAEHELRGPLAAVALAVEQVRRGRSGDELAEVLDAQLARSRAGLADLGAAVGGARRGRVALGRRADRAPGSRVVLGRRRNRAPGSGVALDRSDNGTPAPRVALERLTRHSAAGWAQVAARAGRSVRLEWGAGPVTVEADRGRLAQALGNLLSNAVEHGTGDVEVLARRNGPAIRIEVVNGDERGRGVAPQARLAGAEIDTGRRRSPRRGRGLGIAARAAEGSGGRLEIAREPGRTTAALELPLGER